MEFISESKTTLENERLRNVNMLEASFTSPAPTIVSFGTGDKEHPVNWPRVRFLQTVQDPW